MTIFTIDREKFKTETGKKLYDLLVQISDDNNFLVGILANVKGDKNRQKMIDLIEKEGITDKGTIILASLDIKDGDI